MTLIGMLGKICGPKFRHCCSGHPVPVLPVASKGQNLVPRQHIQYSCRRGAEIQGQRYCRESGAKQQTASFCGHKSVDIIFFLYSFLGANKGDSNQTQKKKRGVRTNKGRWDYFLCSQEKTRPSLIYFVRNK